MAVTVISKLKHKNGTSAVVDAVDVEMANGVRLDATVQQAMAIVSEIGDAVTDLQTATSPAESVDLSEFESNGIIEQTNVDGSVVVYQFHFDAETGNPTKITDSNGNETVLMW
jgi:hypothetical protein